MSLVPVPKVKIDKVKYLPSINPSDSPQSESSKLNSFISPGGNSNFGIRRKPEACRRCPLSLVDHGFVPDEYPLHPKIAVLLERPGQEEVLEGRPLWGKSGQLWLKKLIYKLGYSREEVLICNTLRCYNQRNEYPTGWLKKQAETCCRVYDGWNRTPVNGEMMKGGLDKYNANLYIATFHPAYILRVPAFYWPVLRALELAFKKAKEGYRPLVLMGDRATFMIAPWLERDERGRGSGGMKTWQRHYWEGEWKK